MGLYSLKRINRKPEKQIKGKETGHFLNIKYSHKGAPVKQVQKRFNPDEIKATEISLGRLGRQRR